MKCPICNAENEPDAESCRQCGFGLGIGRLTGLDFPKIEIPGPLVQPPSPEAPPVESPAPPIEAEQFYDIVPEHGPVVATHEPAPTPPDVGVQPEAELELPARIDELLADLGPDRAQFVRARAAELLGKMDASDRQIIEALIATKESDPDYRVRMAAALSLGTRVHRRLLEEYPELMQAAAAKVTSPSRSAAMSSAGTWTGKVLTKSTELLEQAVEITRAADLPEAQEFFEKLIEYAENLKSMR